ncbi:hypothetical protein HF638_04760 [Paenibacillus sp. SZ31]|uniref:hypothetical protein n=1 Tax=Paenibacillus sp. SZ31 TaxID=2725555 RepID=UPI00146DE2D0|nr:hypothetical protein [Paenibacillus sp. SZ31]NMI03272.1 hypothetical protein [Paenibacillus sp. SZ31]
MSRDELSNYGEHKKNSGEDQESINSGGLELTQIVFIGRTFEEYMYGINFGQSRG